ncbi:CapA family protein [Paenibacillus segetis]|uniref:Capsular polysaccharide biosynthesis protein n=1 Tax=Paenibacillus segetis TaxID=1325360 RepID=A0ABQ1YH58_9BACL|nr:CapA family protein [Paenibacillus segetis]GGH24333.1 capsular polysaccharide biosynthesis protein [Paenibacillus segetis]
MGARMIRRFICVFIILILTLPATIALGEPEVDKTDQIRLTFVGDILLDGYVGDQIAKFGVNYPFEKVAPKLKQADMAFANLETPVSTKGKPVDNKTFVFRSKPTALAGLVYAGVDGVTVANNHILDYGKDAMLDTIVQLNKYKIGYTGAGKNIKEAFSPYVKTIKDKKIAVLGVSRVLSGPSWYAGEKNAGAASAYTLEPLLTEIKKSTQENDFTIVYLHWNEEFKDYPEPYARKLAKQMIDSGADMIIGAHSHCLMGIEYYQHKPIYYSLGNFVFNRSTRGGDKTLDSMIVDFEIKGSKITSKITPVKIIHGQPNFMPEAYNKKTIKLLNKLSYNAKIDAHGNVTEK